MLAGQGFQEVLNLTGGIKGWNSDKAIGGEQLGLNLFSGRESVPETLIVAYSLEEGLRDFYLEMVARVTDEKARSLFEKLSAIEAKHQDRIFQEYVKIAGTSPDRDDFTKNSVLPAMEGGLTTEEYLKIYPADLNVVGDVISLAMTIEAQALDLYQRAADRAATENTRATLLQIADEERAHLKQLGKLFETQ